MRAETFAGLGEALGETGRIAEGIERLRAAPAIFERLNNDAETARVQALLDTPSSDSFCFVHSDRDGGGVATWNELLPPEHGDVLDHYRASLQWFRARPRAGATITFGHDPAF